MWGGFLITVRDVQYYGGYHDKCGDILSTVGVFSTVGDIISIMGVILSTLGGYHDARGGNHPL